MVEVEEKMSSERETVWLGKEYPLSDDELRIYDAGRDEERRRIIVDMNVMERISAEVPNALITYKVMWKRLKKELARGR